MGEEADKKQDPKAKAPPDKAGDKAAADKKPDAAKSADDASSQRQGVDLRELDLAYNQAKNAEDVLFNKRAIGIGEVVDSLNETDPPSLGDEIMKTLIVAGLGFATGGISAAITGKLISESAKNLSNAVQTALDDGLKEAAGVAQRRLAQPGGNSRSEFFASQGDGLETLRLTALDTIDVRRKAAGDKVVGAEGDKQGAVLSEEIKGAEEYRQKVIATHETARTTQFRESLTKWLNAVSRGEMGQSMSFPLDGRTPGAGTNLNNGKGKGVDRDTRAFAAGTYAPGGVIHCSMGSRSYDKRPFSVSGGGTGFGQIPSIALKGITESTKDRLKGIPIKDLGLPIIANGYIYDGVLDGLAIGNNAVSFGMNETGGVFTSGEDQGWNCMRKATGKGSNVEAAHVILQQDIGVATLDNALIHS